MFIVAISTPDIMVYDASASEPDDDARDPVVLLEEEFYYVKLLEFLRMRNKDSRPHSDT
jgi:hypothetical protein